MFDLYNYSLLLIFAVGLLVILGLSEIGWQLGVRAEGKGGSNLATLESAMLGLLALMIAFTFSMALSRFEARRDAVLNEANAIGTTALRARLLPEPHRADTLKLLTEYVQIRLDIVRAGASLAERMAVVDRSNALQEALWQQAKAMASKDKGLIPTGLFIESLNLMIDNQGKSWRRFAAGFQILFYSHFSQSPLLREHLPATRARSMRNGHGYRSTSWEC